MEIFQIMGLIIGAIADILVFLIFVFGFVKRASMHVSFAEEQTLIRLKAGQEHEISFVHSNQKIWLARAARDILFRAYFRPQFEVPEQKQLGLLKITKEPKDTPYPNYIAAVFITPFPLYPGVFRDLCLKIRTPKELGTYKIPVDVMVEGPKPLYTELIIEVV